MEISKPKYKLAKIVNKYLIIEILALACESQRKLLLLLYSTDKNMRQLCYANFQTIQKSYESYMIVGKTDYNFS